jgi:protein-S-isoprenylcysteine O-methyltransferase Ste14
MLGSVGIREAVGQASPVDRARAYFGVQALGGAVWWAAVFASDDVRRLTLGGWNPAHVVGPDVALFVIAAAVAALTGNRWVALVSATWTAGVTAALVIYGLATQRAGWGVVAMTPATVFAAASAATIWFGRLPTGWFFIGPLSFREADGRPPKVQLRRSLTQLVVFWSAFFIVIPLVLSAVEDRLLLQWDALDASAWPLVGAATWLVAGAIGLWSCFTMALIGHGTPLPAATAPKLVVAGPYRWVRNPMAVAGAFQTIGTGLWFGSWTVIVIAVAGAVVWNELIRPTEEADLLARFGLPYDAYRRAVRCWIPTIPSGPTVPGRAT